LESGNTAVHTASEVGSECQSRALKGKLRSGAVPDAGTVAPLLILAKASFALARRWEWEMRKQASFVRQICLHSVPGCSWKAILF